MKKILLSLLAIFMASLIYAQLDDQPLLLHLEFELVQLQQLLITDMTYVAEAHEAQ